MSDSPRFLLTDALHWDASRVFATWSFRWPGETFHQFAKQLTGFEDAQLRNQKSGSLEVTSILREIGNPSIKFLDR